MGGVVWAQIFTHYREKGGQQLGKTIFPSEPLFSQKNENLYMEHFRSYSWLEKGGKIEQLQTSVEDGRW